MYHTLIFLSSFEQVYRTPDKGWAVRSWDYIPSGAPVCEYIGVLRRSDELDNISGNESNEYIFEIDCLHTINEIEGREVLLQFSSIVCFIMFTNLVQVQLKIVCISFHQKIK